MKRRDFFAAGLGSAGLLALSACQKSTDSTTTDHSAASARKYRWKMVTTWPKNFPGLGTGAEYFAKLVKALSAGQLEIQVYGAGELVPALEVFEAVRQGTAEIGHGAAYYWKAKNPALQFFTAVPFGLTAEEMNGWLYHGGGLALWQDICKPFGLVPLPAGNTGMQMAGWFNKKINTLADLRGLKMRIPGLGGEVFKRLGVIPVNLPGGELFTAMQSGTIDATEWVGPFNDLAFGLHRVAKYYYYPGWQEPGSVMEVLINQQALQALPEHLQNILKMAAQAANLDMFSEYQARNSEALATLQADKNIEILPLPAEVLGALKQESEQILAEIAAQTEDNRRVYQAYQAYRQKTLAWDAIGHQAFLQNRA
jgi:TRAP-type mannitol/chloroaromatic compound transport system substrate-binding protein